MASGIAKGAPPSPQKAPRVTESFSSNLAPSYVPRALLDLTQPGARAQRVESVVKNVLVNNKADLVLLKALVSALRNHFEYRLMTFFIQLLLVYKTKMEFEQRAAEVQMGESVPCGRNYASAHSATLTTLLTTVKESVISWLRGTAMHRTWNATVFVPVQANEIDSALDWQSKDKEGKTFRDKCLAIVNAVSKGEYSPILGFKKCLVVARADLQRLAVRYAEDPEKSYVVSQYAAVVRSYRNKLKEDDGVLKEMAMVRSVNDRVGPNYCLRVQKGLHATIERELVLADCEKRVRAYLERKKVKQNVDEYARWLLLRLSRTEEGNTRTLRTACSDINGQFVYLAGARHTHKVTAMLSEPVQKAVAAWSRFLYTPGMLQLISNSEWKKCNEETRALKAAILSAVGKKSIQGIERVMLHVLYESGLKADRSVSAFVALTAQQALQFERAHLKKTGELLADLNNADLVAVRELLLA